MEDHAARFDAYMQFLNIAHAIVKFNTLFRVRFPPTHPLYSQVERAMFGVFFDMPLELLTFASVIEDMCTREERDDLTKRLTQTVWSARIVVNERPKRARSGKLIYKKTLPLPCRTLLDEISKCARTLFDTVYACFEYNDDLIRHERLFWNRYNRVHKASYRCKRDPNDLYIVLLCLSTVLPTPAINTSILRMTI